jgi:class 3 adenylate cyclase
MTTAMRVHDEAHGNVAKDVIEVDLSAVEAFLGRVSDPPPTSPEAKVTFDPALRAIMFTDIVDSTGITARPGDVRGVEMVRAHDAMVRRALKDSHGREIKHTGDGIMASFDHTNAAVQCARAIQQAFDALTSRVKRSCALCRTTSSSS